MQTEDSLETISAKGTKFKMFPKGFLWKVPSKAATITTLPSLAKYSLTYTISGKNCPSSIATTSWVRALGIIEVRVAVLIAFIDILNKFKLTYHEWKRHLR
jgi:hypothetical protein